MTHPSEDALLLLAYDELGEPQAAELAAHLVACTDCRARLEAIERARVAADWALASRAVPRRAIPRAVGLGALAAAAVLAVVWLWPPPRQRPLPLSLAVPRYAAPGLVPIDSILTRLEQENLYAIP
jgi:anti-sigma factor ChrR (cupin superfamily)